MAFIGVKVSDEQIVDRYANLKQKIQTCDYEGAIVR